jgi:threonine dehydrogenase-like Zn-dependent dehydrogenase
VDASRALRQDATMRACALVAPQRLALVDAPSPPLGPHDVRIRPRAVGVCGTDLHIFAGESNFHFDAEGRAIPLEASPQILGHEIAGEVVEVGGVTHQARDPHVLITLLEFAARFLEREPDRRRFEWA